MEGRDSSTSPSSTAANRDVSSLTDGDGLAKDATLHFESGKFAECVEVLNQLLQKKPDDPKNEFWLEEARCIVESSNSEAVKKAVNSEMQNIQDELDKCTKERDAVAEVNRKLIEKSKIWKDKLKKAEEREAATAKLMNKKIVDLEGQIRDIKVRLQMRKRIDMLKEAEERDVAAVKLLDEQIAQLKEEIRDIVVFLDASGIKDEASGIKDGTVLLIAPKEASSPGGNSKRNRKSGRKRN